MSLPRQHRLRKRQDFSVVYQKGSRFSSRYLTLRALSAEKRGLLISSTDRSLKESPPTQIGISISQKVSKRSVVRNRIKRQIKAAIRQLLPQIAGGWQLVIVVHPSAQGCEYVHFLQQLEQLLISAEVINGDTRGCLL